MLARPDTAPFPPSLVFPDVEPEILQQEALRELAASRGDRGFAWLSFRVGVLAPPLAPVG